MSPSLKLKVATLNCWALPQPWPIGSKDRKYRLEKLADCLNEGEYDIVGLQELWSEYDYLELADRVNSVFMFSHYFHSGFTGSGVAVLSKYPIVSTLTHRYSLNGFAHHIHHGDWFGGKVVGMVELEIGDKRINFYSTHLHAEYNRENDLYLPHRLAQSFELSQFVRHTSRGADFVVLSGDMNMEPEDLGVRLIMSNTKMIDAWRLLNKDPFAKDSNLNDSSMKVESIVSGMTCDRPDNVYANSEQLQKCPEGKRLDYIFYKSGRLQVNLVECGNCFNKIPGENLNYSDHIGVYATFNVEDNNRQLSMTFEHEIPLIKEVIEIVKEGQIRARKDRSLFYAAFFFLIFLIISSLVLDRFFPFISIPLSVLRFCLTAIAVFCIWYGFLGLTMELKALKGTRQAMGQLLNE